MIRMLPLLLLLGGCGQPEYSPWQSNPPETDLTAKHLGWLDSTNGEFKPFKVALVGDPQAVIGDLHNVGEVINARSDIDFTLVAGDITDRGLRTEFVWVTNVIKEFDRPVLTVVGNHDGLANGPKLYSEVFGPLNYSFIYKDIKFIMWNNNAYEWNVDMDWLESEVNSFDKVVVVSHQPPGETAYKFDEERWAKIRESPNMIASLHGHVHHYAFKREGDLPIYTVDRVMNSHYGTITFDYDGIKFENCDSTCREVK